MAGTDSTRRPAKTSAAGRAGAPAVILIEPQLGENIGMAARAMLNCGLHDLRLVRPRHGWPNEHARSPAAGADVVLDQARVFETTEDAIQDLQLVYATTARPRGMTKDVLAPREAAVRLRAFQDGGGAAGVVFGREARGLNNDDVALADAIIAAPLNPGFQSLNLAQAVFAVAYEWFQAGDDTPAARLSMPKETRPANKQELHWLFEHLEEELDACGFLRVTEKRPVMVRNLRNILQRAGLTEQEVRTLRGVISGLAGRDRGSKP